MTVNAACDCFASVLFTCALFEGLTEFCFVFQFVFYNHFVGFHVDNRAITLATTAYGEFWRIFIANTVTHAHRRCGCDAVFMKRDCCSDCLPTCRTLYALVSSDLLSHSRHNSGDRSAKVGHEIKRGYMFELKCVCDVRYHTEMYKCLYGALKNACNATASAIYTNYHLTIYKRWLATIDCDVSE